MNKSLVNNFQYLVDKCSPNDKYICKNGGTCHINSRGEAECLCLPRNYGDNCQKGLLQLLFMNIVASLFNIHSQFNTLFNDTKVYLLDKCFPYDRYLCKNNGHCKINESSGEAFCECSMDYEGIHCEKG